MTVSRRPIALHYWLLLLSALLAATSLVACSTRTAYPQPMIAGTWNVEGSSAVFRISHRGHETIIEGEDSSDGEAFRVSNVRWDGRILRADFLMPSTDWRTHSELTLIDPDTLQGTYKDDSPEIWRRAK
jgi:hypothetical protein